MNKHISLITLLLLSYSLSMPAAADTILESNTAHTEEQKRHFAFTPQLRECAERKFGGDEPHRWFFYHPTEKPYVAIAHRVDVVQRKNNAEMRYRIREAPGCIMIALFEGIGDTSDAIDKVSDTFLDSIDLTEVCKQASHSEGALGNYIRLHAKQFGKETIEREKEILASHTDETYNSTFAQQWNRKPVRMNLILSVAWHDRTARDPQRYCRHMVWVQDEKQSPDENEATSYRFIKPVKYAQLAAQYHIVRGFESLTAEQQNQMRSKQNMLCLTRALAEHLQPTLSHAHHVIVSVDGPALDIAAKDSIPQDASQKIYHVLVDEELSTDQSEYLKNAQHVAQEAVTRHVSCFPHLQNKASAVIEQLTPLLTQVLIDNKGRDFADRANVSSYDLFQKEVISIFSKDYTNLIVLDDKILQFIKDEREKADFS